MIAIVVLFQLMGIVSSIHAILGTRTSQGSIAWLVSLNTLPLIAVPAYWFFGRSKFVGYMNAWRDNSLNLEEERKEIYAGFLPYIVENLKAFPEYEAIKQLSHPFLTANKVNLLIDGQATYDSIYKGIEQAQSYVLFQFYILRSDSSGERFKKQLLNKAREGVKVHVLYDEIGSAGLEKKWLQDFSSYGIRIIPFNTRQGSRNRFQLNFRNHRKIVVVDGKSAWLGGLNIGDDYLGKDKKLSPWRDTHIRIEGPAALVAQSIFWSDWYWADKTLLKDLSWKPVPADGLAQSDLAQSKGEINTNQGKKVLVLGSGPADKLETAGLFYTIVLNSARKRIWIATPYFIPDEGTLISLSLALLKGIDVRIITPALNDNWFVRHAANVYLSELAQLGAKIFFFQKGFMHQKVMLIDDDISLVGTVNFDNRSFRLNFEVTGAVADHEFASQVETMLLDDLANSNERVDYNLSNESLWERLKARGSALLAPVL